MRPRKRYLKCNEGTEGPTSLLFFDTEARTPKELPFGHGWELSLRLWVACHVRREGTDFTREAWYRGTTAREFWNMLESLHSWKRPLWAFAHNLGYDLTQTEFWGELENCRWTSGPVERGPSPKTGKPRKPWMGRLVLEGRPTFLILRNQAGILRLIDSGNYWPTALEKIGEKFGLPKLPMPAWDEPDTAWFDYCTRDVEVLRVAVCELLKWWLKEDCGTFKMTAASLSMTNFQHAGKCRTKDGKAINLVLEDDSPARKIERAAFLGGRIEPFYLGKMTGPIYELDCNSLYLSAMSGNLFPRARTRKLHAVTPERLHNLMGVFGAVADVLIDTRTHQRTYPVKRYGLQFHACGRFWATLCGPELLRALNAHDVVAVGECHLYSLAELFKGWADDWFNRKLEAKRRGDAGEYEFCKLVGTSLVGKFAQRGEWWVDAPERSRRKKWGYITRDSMISGKVTRYRWIGGHVQKRVEGQEPAGAFPIVSAYVTAYAREWMGLVFRQCPERSILYTATDSILCTHKGFAALQRAGLVDPEKLGHFRVEEIHPDAEICGPNWYRIGDAWVCSGMHGRAVRGANGEAICEVWDQLPGILAHKPAKTCLIQRVELSSMRPSVKNSPDGDGWRKPLWLSPVDEFTDRPSRFVQWPVRRE